MKQDTDLERFKDCCLFAHLTYTILSASCLVGWFKTNQIKLADGYDFVWAIIIIAVLALIPAQNKIITKTLYQDYRGLYLYKILYSITVCAIYLPIIFRFSTDININIITIVPVILNSIICGTGYGIFTSLAISIVDIYQHGLSSPQLTEHILMLTILGATAWFIGQSFEYIINLFYQLDESEKHHKHVLNSIGVATLHIDPYGNIVYSNQPFQDLTGADTEKTASVEIIQKHLPFLDPKLDDYSLLNSTPIFGQAINNQGQSVPVQCIICPLKSVAEEKQSFIICINDISLSRKLEEERIRTNYFMDFIDAGTILTDASGKIVEMNRQAEYLMDISKSNSINKNFQEIIRHKLGQETTALMCGSNEELELGERTLLVNNVELRSKNNHLVGNVCIINDITARKDMEKKLHRSATLSAIGELAAGTAHEIKNPLTSIKGFLQLMQDRKEAKISELEEYFNIILPEVDRINSIIIEFLKLAKPEKIKLVQVNLNEIIDSIWELFNSEALLREINLAYQLDTKIPCIMGNVDSLKQVIINLVNNALQATQPGGTVKVITTVNHNKVKLFIEDNGTGIDKDTLPRIFDPFFTTKDEGTGLGLAISSKIINDHNASINVLSKPGQGTKIYITFPLNNQNPPA